MKPFYVVDKRATDYAQLLKKHYPAVSLAESDVIVVLGGDGTMLNSMHRYHGAKKPFYGINCGTRGALMNVLPAHPSNVLDHMNVVPTFTLHPLSCIVEEKNGTKTPILAFNEICFFRKDYHAMAWSLCVNHIPFVTNAKGDGVIFCTPCGSHAYNASAGGSLLHHNLQALMMTPLCGIDHYPRSTVFTSSTVLTFHFATPYETCMVSWDTFHQHKIFSRCQITVCQKSSVIVKGGSIFTQSK